LLLLGNAFAICAPVDRSVSASHQFIVYGVTAPLRGAVADAAERTKANILNLLQQRDDWKIPIILSLEFPQANVPDTPGTILRFSQTGAGLKIQLDLTIDRNFEPLSLRRQLVRLVLLEMAYRQHQDLAAGSFYIEPPDWLLEGVLAADPQQDRPAMIAAVGPLVNEESVLTLDQFLGQRLHHLESVPAELLYRGYAYAFLQLLLNDSGGSARLANYISNLSRTSNDPVSDLKVFFPVLAGGSAIPLWKASVASLKLRDYELLTAAETERQLQLLLGEGEAGGAPGRIKLAGYLRRKNSRSQIAELGQLKQKLIVLASEGNPILRSLVVEYQNVVERIIARKIKGIETRLATLARQRQQIAIRVSDMDDYMNWFEATKLEGPSDAFTGYLRAAARSEETQSRRRDPLSVYLDALEEQF
jgi:hypothetical protein